MLGDAICSCLHVSKSTHMVIIARVRFVGPGLSDVILDLLYSYIRLVIYEQ